MSVTDHLRKLIISRARDSSNQTYGRSHGWVEMTNCLPFRFIAISDQSVCPEPVPDRLNRLSKLGVPAVQIRDKSVDDRTRYTWLRKTKRRKTHWLMNGRVDFALLEDLDGVHRASTGIPLQELIRIGGKDLIYGQSTHTFDGVQRAFEGGADYVLYGPVYPTPSKPNLGEDDIPGLDGLESVTNRVDGPVLALGGVTPDRVSACLDAGAYGVAGIRVLFAPEDPRSTWNKIQSSLKEKE